MDIEKALRELADINRKYELKADHIIQYAANIDRDLLCIPIVGQFSSGKSAAVNTLLGYRQKILIEDITPETAFPAEIQYRFDPKSEESALVTFRNKDTEVMPLDVFRKRAGNKELKACDIASVRLRLGNAFFAQIPKILLVDMPGFGSGDTVHDNAINNYVANSMVYIIAFSVDKMVLGADIKNIIKELLVFKKPFSVMLTKADKAPPPEEYEKLFENLINDLKKTVGNQEIDFIETSSKNGDIGELKDYLLKQQERAGTVLLEQKHMPFLAQESLVTLSYLRERLAKNDFSESNLKEQEERLTKDMEQLMQRVDALSEAFRKDMERCEEEIIGDVRMALNNELERYVAMAMNRSDGQAISEQMNADVRIAANKSVQQRFVEKLRKYEENITVEVEASQMFVALAAGGTGGAGSIAGVAAGIAFAKFGANIGMAFVPIMLPALAIPGIGIIAAVVGGIAGLLATIFAGARKREETKEQLRQQLRAVIFPAALNDVRSKLSVMLKEKAAEVSDGIKQQLEDRKATLEKALADCRKQQDDEAAGKTQTAAMLQADIVRLEDLCRG